MARVYVKADGSGDYTTLAAAIGAGQTDIEIQGTWNNAETSQYTVSAATTIRATGDAKHPGHLASSPTHWRARPTAAGHVFTTSADLTLIGLDIQNGSTGTSDECVRIDGDNITVSATDCLIGFSSKNSQQDLCYSNQKTGITVNLTNTIGYNAGRSGVGAYSGFGSMTLTVNINACSFYDIGSLNEGRAGIIGVSDFNVTAAVFNSLLHVTGAYATSERVFGRTVGSEVMSIACDRCITNQDQIDHCTETDTLLSATWTDDNTKSSDGDWVIVGDLTASTLDLRLQDNTYNEAQGAHSDSSGAGLTMPSTDMLGETRSAPYCIGAYRYVSAGQLPIIDTAALTGITGAALASSDQSSTLDPAALISPGASILGGMDSGTALDLPAFTSVAASILAGVTAGVANETPVLLSAMITPLTGDEKGSLTDVAALVPAGAVTISAMIGNALIDTSQLTQAGAVILPAAETAIANDTGTIKSIPAVVIVGADQAAALDAPLLVNGQGQPMASIESLSVVDHANLAETQGLPIPGVASYSLTDIASLTDALANMITAVVSTDQEINAIFGTPIIIPILSGRPDLKCKLNGTPSIIKRR